MVFELARHEQVLILELLALVAEVILRVSLQRLLHRFANRRLFGRLGLSRGSGCWKDCALSLSLLDGYRELVRFGEDSGLELVLGLLFLVTLGGGREGFENAAGGKDVVAQSVEEVECLRVDPGGRNTARRIELNPKDVVVLLSALAIAGGRPVLSQLSPVSLSLASFLSVALVAKDLEQHEGAVELANSV